MPKADFLLLRLLGCGSAALPAAQIPAQRCKSVLLADEQLLEYRGRGVAIDGVAWKRRADVPDLRCLRR